MNELTQIKVKDNATGKIYRLIGFSVGGDDRAGFPLTQIVLYNEFDRIRITVKDTAEMRRLQIIKE